jgi:MFS family permease
MSDDHPDVGAFDEPKENPVVKYFKDFKVLKKTKREYWGLQVINMLDCLAYFAMFNIIVVTLSNDYGATDIQAGAIFAAFSSMTTIFLFISGVLTDWLGIKRALYLAMIGLILTRGGMIAVQYMDEPVRMSPDTPISILYDGAGIAFQTEEPDLVVTARNGSHFQVDLSGSQTIGDVLDRINNAPGNNGTIVAKIALGWTNLKIEDKTGGAGELVISGPAADALKIETDGAERSEFAGSRLISDLNGVEVAEINQGRGLMDGSSVTITDRLGKSMTVDGLDQAEYVMDLIDMLIAGAQSQPANVRIQLNTPGNGIRISDLNKAPDGSDLKEGHLIVTGDAAEALHIARDADDEANDTIAGSSLVHNTVRTLFVWVLLIIMAPFVAMLITVFQAGNRRFTTSKSRGAGFNLWYLFMNVGAAGGGFLIDIIYLRMGLPHFHIFTFGLITGALCLIAIVLFIRNTDQLREDDEVEAEAGENGETANSGDIKEIDPETGEPIVAQKKPLGPWGITKAVLSEPVFWRFTVLITLLLGVRAVFLYLGLLFPKFWYRVIGPDAQVGTLQALNPIMVIIGLILVIPILQKFNVYKMLVFGALITSISMFIPAIPQMGDYSIETWTYITTAVFLLVLTVGELIWSPRLSEYTAAIAPEGQEGTYLGLSMVPYFLAKLVVSALSGAMLYRWCREYPPGEPTVGDRLEAGQIEFINSPYMMWVILGAVALVGTIIAILGKPWFTKGAHFD